MKKILTLIILSFILFTSCKRDALDIDPQNAISEEAVWKDESLIKAYHSELYSGIPHGFYIHMYSKYTDEAYNSAPCCGADLFKLNTYNADNIGGANSGDFWGGYMYYWNHGYSYLRKVNVFLEQMAAQDALDFTIKKVLLQKLNLSELLFILI